MLWSFWAPSEFIGFVHVAFKAFVGSLEFRDV